MGGRASCLILMPFQNGSTVGYATVGGAGGAAWVVMLHLCKMFFVFFNILLRLSCFVLQTAARAAFCAKSLTSSLFISRDTIRSYFSWL